MNATTIKKLYNEFKTYEGIADDLLETFWGFDSDEIDMMLDEATDLEISARDRLCEAIEEFTGGVVDFDTAERMVLFRKKEFAALIDRI